jgi:hypothetical protein
MWAAVAISTLAALVSVGVAWWQTRTVTSLRRELSQAQGEMRVFVAQVRASVADWEEDRKRQSAATAALLEANRHAYETIRNVLSAPGVPAHLAGDWLRSLAEAGPSTSGSEDPGAVPPITRGASTGRPSRK